jgi:hypothetical protein
MSAVIGLVSGRQARQRRRRLCGYCRAVMRRRAMRCTYCGHHSLGLLHIALFVAMLAVSIVVTFNLLSLPGLID